MQHTTPQIKMNAVPQYTHELKRDAVMNKSFGLEDPNMNKSLGLEDPNNIACHYMISNILYI